MSGAWVFRGTRVPAAALFENLEDGASLQDFVAWFPGVSLEAGARRAGSCGSKCLGGSLRVLFDQGTPAPLRRFLTGHAVETAHERGWSRLQNGELLDAAESAGFEVFVTTDRNLKYQQHLTGAVASSIVVLLSTSWPRIRQAIELVVEAVAQATPGSYSEVSTPGFA